MKKRLMLCATAVTAVSLFAADANPKDELAAAAKKLGDQPNYSWKTTIVVPADAQFKPGPTDGRTEKDGVAHFKMTFFDNPWEAAVKGDKGAATNQEGEWQSLAEMDAAEGPGRFLGAMVRNLKTPVKEATDIVGFAKEIKKEGEVFSADLTEEGAKTLQSFGRRGAEGGPSVSNASGSARFWVKDGALTKYEFKLKGLINWNGNEMPNDRTTTVEIKDVGTTKVELPEAAKKKLT